jgi:hypothetical protein
MNNMKTRKKPKKIGSSWVKRYYYINGKRKSEISEYMDGLPIQEWYAQNAGPIDRLVNGEYWLADAEYKEQKKYGRNNLHSDGGNDEWSDVLGVELICEDESGNFIDEYGNELSMNENSITF